MSGNRSIDILKVWRIISYSKLIGVSQLMMRGKDELMDQSRETLGRGTYGKKESAEGRLMSVAEMGRVLGLKKTERYWLVHKNYFETQIFLGRIWVVRDSFECWYANQVKYRKVDGEEPGSNLRKQSYSARDIAQILGVYEATAYEVIKRNHIKTIEVNGWRRVPKEAFEEWYTGQDRYRTQKDRDRDAVMEQESITMPEMARLLGIDRKQVYLLLQQKKYRDIFSIIMIAGKKRITKESFRSFLEMQDKYSLVPENEETGQNPCRAESSDDVVESGNAGRGDGDSSFHMGNAGYVSIKEAASLAGISRNAMASRMARKSIPSTRIGKKTMIKRRELEKCLMNDSERTGKGRK